MKNPRIIICPDGYAHGYCGQASGVEFRELDSDTRTVADPLQNEGLRRKGGARKADKIEHRWLVHNMLTERESCST